MQFRTAAGGKRKGKGGNKGRRNSEGSTVTVLGKDLVLVDATLRRVLGGLAVVGAMVALAAVVLVKISVSRGLIPLRKLAAQTRAIDADSLNLRFDSADSPEELQPVYEHLNDLVNRLETSFERERQFNSDLAHEMRTPIAELQMINEVALKWEDQAGEKTHRESLDIARQLATTVETLLALARCESGELSVEKEPVDLVEFTSECLSVFAKRAEEKNLQISLDFPSPNPTFHTDREMFRHIVSNLLSNAVDYTDEGGTIEITGTENELEIANDAANLDESELNRLFERYWRKDDVRTSRSHVGLGLPLAKSLANALNLKLEATKDGSKIRFRMSPV